jgi:flagellar basal body-associated protein FliL
MAEKPENNEANNDKKKSRAGAIKAILLVAAILFLEAGTIIGTMYFGGGPAEVKGEGITPDNEAELNKLVEIQLVEGKFTNERTGRTYVYDAEIFATVKQKHADQFKEELESMKQRVRSEIDAIFRGADPAFFAERERSTLTRQIESTMKKRFGDTAEGESIVQDVVIGKCLPYRQY